MKTLKFILAAIFVSGLVSVAVAQDKVVTVNSDGSYSVIEYPVDKEVTVSLMPSASLHGGKGTARVMRTSNGTKVWFDVNGLPSTTSSYYAYAVDPSGTPTLLGPINVTNGVATAEFTTPMDQFMLVVSPAQGLTGLTSSNVIFTSEVPSGYTVVPRRVMNTPVSAVAGVSVVKYDVPLLNVSSFGRDARTVKLHFDDTQYKGLDAKAHIHRHDDGMTTVRMEFDDLKKIPANSRFVLWAYSPDGTYTKLGQIYNSGRHDNMVIDAKTSLNDFGLLLTAEESDVTVPTGRSWSVFRL
jgi:hypothetical protein